MVFQLKHKKTTMVCNINKEQKKVLATHMKSNCANRTVKEKKKTAHYTHMY